MSAKKLQEALNLRIVQHYTALDADGNYVSPPSTDDELDEFIRAAYGVRLPRKIVTEGHKTQFNFIADLFFDRVQNALGFAARTGGKCLALDTLVLCDDGFRSMEDIEPGHRVFAPDGTSTQVVDVSETHMDHDCYRIKIDSNEIVSDGDHMWEVTYVRHRRRELRTMTTRQMYEFLQDPPKSNYKTFFWIGKTAPLQLPHRDLPVDPYVLGVYLGDGCRYNSVVTCEDPEIIENVRSLGYEINKHNVADGKAQTYRIAGLRQTLKSHFSNCPAPHMPKSVPTIYLLASFEQRLSLLQGLMDTDGTRPRVQHYRCEFDTTDRDLAEAVRFLVASLGGKPTLYERGPGRCNGKLGKDRFRVTFHPEPGWNPFRLSRKADLVRVSPKSTNHRIISIEKVDTVPVRCIQVEHNSHLFLAGVSLVPTHNTFGVAILNHLDMTFKPGCEIASAGAVLDQANKCYRYFRGFLDLPWFKDLQERYRNATGKSLCDLRNALKCKTEFGNGSLIEIVTATESGLRGPHPHKARIDEIDEIEWETLQTGLSMSQSGKDASGKSILGQNVFTSTRQKMHGSMQKMLDEASERGIAVYEWNVWEMLEKCERRCHDDPEHGTCPIYTFCKGKAHHCDGFYSIVDFINKVRMMDRTKFETEWLNEKPSKERFVYPNFSHARHVMTPDRLHRMTGARSPFDVMTFNWRRIAAIDFGSSPGHPFVYLKLTQLPTGPWLVGWEYVAEQRLLRDHATSIKESPAWHSGEFPFADHDAQDRIELASHGVYTRAARKGPDTVSVGIDLISSLLNGFPPKEDPMLYVWHECDYTIKEFGTYSWPIRHDGKPDRTGRPLQENDHAMDALRYALFTLHRAGSGPKYTARTIKGV